MEIVGKYVEIQKKTNGKRAILIGAMGRITEFGVC